MQKIVLPITRALFRAWPVLVLLLSLSGPAISQTISAGLKIQVLDQNRAVMPNVRVVITSKDGLVSQEQRTASDGTVNFQNLKTGDYIVSITVQGFKSIKQEVTVGVTESASLEVVLETAVAEDEATRQPEEQEAVSALPNQNNDLSTAFQVAPGALPLGSTALGQVIVDGRGLDQLTARLDGIDFTVLTGMPFTDPAIDPVSSFSSAAVANNLDKFALRRGAFEARYGPGAGAISDNVTYTGFGREKGKWTAEFYEEIQNDFFNSRNFFDLEGKNGLRRNRFGGKSSRSLDDLARSNIFVAYDGMRGRLERPVYEAVPTDAVCCLTQPFAGLFRSYVPAGTQIVSGASLNPDFLVARRRVRTTANSNAFDIRFEHHPFNTKDTSGQTALKLTDLLTVRFTRQGSETLVPDGVTGRHQRQNILFNNLLTSFQFDTSSNTTHTVRYGLNAIRARVATEILPESDPSLTAALITTSGTVAVTGLPGNTATVGIASLGAAVKGTGRGFRIAPMSSSLSYEFQHKFEKHTLNAGVEGRWIRVGLDRLGGLSYSFSNIAALRTGTPSSVAFQSDLSAPGPFSSGIGQRQARQEYAMGYIQMLSSIGHLDDDPTFKNEMNARLRVTYGLRYDYFSPVRERDGRAVLVDPSTGAILPPGTSFYRTRKLNFQPRASFIYRFADDGFLGRTVLNGGAGVYSGTARTGDYLLPIDSDRFSTGMTALPFPVDSSVLVNNFLTHPETRQFQPLTFSRDFVAIERVYKWDVRLAHTVSGYDIAVLYSGNVGRDLPLANFGNKIIAVTTNPDPTKVALVQREFDFVSGGQIFKPFGEFLFRTSDGRSSFDSLTIQFSRNRNARPIPTNNWLAAAVASFNAQYILSRSVGNASGAVLSNPFDLNSDFGDNIGTPRHLFKFSAVYELWRAKGTHVTKSLLSWRIMPLLTVRSGLPLLVRLNRPDVVYVDANGALFSNPAVGRTAVINTPGGGESAGTRVPDLISGINPYLRNDREYLNPAAFAIPAPGKFGNLRRGQLHGPNSIQLDLGLRRNIFETEGLMSAQFQIDIFNVFNRTNFVNPTAPLPGLLGTSIIDNQLQPGLPFNRGAAGAFGILSAADRGRAIQFSVTFRLNDGFTNYRIR